MGDWSPQTISFEELLIKPNPKDQLSKPYPFYLAYALEDSFDQESADDWFVEHKWDGAWAANFSIGGMVLLEPRRRTDDFQISRF